jgi:hypothetical protein
MDPQDVGRPDGPRQTCSVSWDLDPDKLIRPRSADSIKARGHYAAPIGEREDVFCPFCPSLSHAGCWQYPALGQPPGGRG